MGDTKKTYYITTPIIMELFESHAPIESITVMVQKEVADRMQVGPGTKDYGALSLAVQYYSNPKVEDVKTTLIHTPGEKSINIIKPIQENTIYL